MEGKFMKDKEEKLSNYIDCLNKERKPDEHASEMETLEMNELFETIRLVRSLKEPSSPRDGYEEKLVYSINKQLLNKNNSRKPRKKWFWGMASAAAVIALIVTLNTPGHFRRVNMVSAMEQAFSEIKAYHGILKIVETNEEGKATTQSKIEVWADKEGRYYVKGLEGSQKDLITVNDGEKKWQVQPEQKEVDIFQAFPDPYAFTFEIGKEIKDVKNAVKTKVIGEEKVAGRDATVMEVTPQGGTTYKIWIDKETKMPLQKQSAMEYSLQYKISYESVDFRERVPKELLTYNIPEGFKEINTNSGQVVNSMKEGKEIVGFTPREIKNIPSDFNEKSMEIINSNTVKINYISQDNKDKVAVLQKKTSEEFKPVSMAVLGRVNNKVAEMQSPVQNEVGVLTGGGAYARATDINSIRWQEGEFEYAVVGNIPLEELSLFAEELSNGEVELPSLKEESLGEAQVKVPVDLKIEEAEQRSVDGGHSPWRLDPAFVTQVFVSLKISPEGIQGDYPIKYEEIKIVQNNGIKAIAEIGGDITSIKRVYLERLIRQDNTGIWTVIGYDPS